MLSFESDYTEGAHPNILRQLMATNMDQEPAMALTNFPSWQRKEFKRHWGTQKLRLNF